MTIQLKDIREAYYPDIHVPKYMPDSKVNTLLNGLPWHRCTVVSYKLRPVPYQPNKFEMSYTLRLENLPRITVTEWESSLESAD